MEKRYFLKPGYIFFSSEGHVIETILGSCISVTLWDKKNKMGVMIHYIYAYHREEERKPSTGKIALPFALEIMLGKGSNVKNLIACVAGGGKNPKLSDKVSIENIDYAMKFLNEKGIKIDVIDVGLNETRKAIFNSSSGEFQVKHIG